MRHPVVIIGAGPVGLRCAQEILSNSKDNKVIVYGREQWKPYNRVRLSGFLGGDYSLADIELPDFLVYGKRFELRTGVEVVAIDRVLHQTTTRCGKQQHYSKLILATGSSAYIPKIAGIEKHGVYAFRDLEDAIALQARQTMSRDTVVIGGGLLGLEAARAMRVYRTNVVVVEHNHHLMYQQLDSDAGLTLQHHIEQMNINVLTNNAISEVVGEERVEGVRLRGNTILSCDTVIVAAGIRPNIQLALDSGLAVGKGIKVNNQLQTSDSDIFAIGDCAEHQETVYGLVAPGYEQASVVATIINGSFAQYLGSVTSTTLKVAGCPVFSMGDIDRMRDSKGEFVYTDPETHSYRRLLIENGRLTGGIGIGDWANKSRMQEAIQKKRRIFFWQHFNFKRHGELWTDESDKSVAAWPASAIVCNCTGVTRGELSQAMARGRSDFNELSKDTGASTVCGSCKPDIVNLLGSSQPIPAIEYWKTIFIVAAIATVFSLTYVFSSGLNYQGSVVADIRWDLVWRDSFIRKVTGFTLLGLGVVLSVISLRKRIKSFAWLEYPVWRIVHVILGGLAVLGLLVHSGARMGENLNYWLMFSFLGTLLTGGLVGVIMSNEHQLPARAIQRARRWSLWGHLLFLWPLPILLAFHILKAFYFS